MKHKGQSWPLNEETEGFKESNDTLALRPAHN